MNYDPVKFCWRCQKSKKREFFVPLSGKRECCAECAEIIFKRDAQLKELQTSGERE